MFLVFLNYFDVLILKIILKNKKNIIDMYFSMKSYLKSNYNHIAKQTIYRDEGDIEFEIRKILFN